MISRFIPRLCKLHRFQPPTKAIYMFESSIYLIIIS